MEKASGSPDVTQLRRGTGLWHRRADPRSHARGPPGSQDPHVQSCVRPSACRLRAGRLRPGAEPPLRALACPGRQAGLLAKASSPGLGQLPPREPPPPGDLLCHLLTTQFHTCPPTPLPLGAWLPGGQELAGPPQDTAPAEVTIATECCFSSTGSNQLTCPGTLEPRWNARKALVTRERRHFP